MSPLLRIEMIALAFLFIVIVFFAVNRRKLQMRHSLIWLFLSFVLLLSALFPSVVIWASDLVGIQTPSNFIYLLAIFFLLVLCFFLTANLSRQADKIKRIIQVVSIERYLQDEKQREAGRKADGNTAPSGKEKGEKA